MLCVRLEAGWSVCVCVLVRVRVPLPFGVTSSGQECASRPPPTARTHYALDAPTLFLTAQGGSVGNERGAHGGSSLPAPRPPRRGHLGPLSPGRRCDSVGIIIGLLAGSGRSTNTAGDGTTSRSE